MLRERCIWKGNGIEQRTPLMIVRNVAEGGRGRLGDAVGHGVWQEAYSYLETSFS